MGPRAASPRWAVLVVPALLLAVAGFQVVRVVTLDQSTWIGGGFGMFATYDYDDTRVVTGWYEAPGSRPAVTAPISTDLLLRARVVPSEANARRVAEAILETGEAPAGATAVVVEVRGRELVDDMLSFPVLVRVVVPTDGAAP
jgi:hypothetical protein